MPPAASVMTRADGREERYRRARQRSTPRAEDGQQYEKRYGSVSLELAGSHATDAHDAVATPWTDMSRWVAS